MKLLILYLGTAKESDYILLLVNYIYVYVDAPWEVREPKMCLKPREVLRKCEHTSSFPLPLEL